LHNIIFRDSTIREGIETPLLSLTSYQKLEIVKRIFNIGIKEFEILSPNCIEETYEIGSMIKESGMDITTTGFVFQWTNINLVEEQIKKLKDVVDRFIIVAPGSQANLKLRKTTLKEVQADIFRLLELLNRYGKEPELGIMDVFQMDNEDFRLLIEACKDKIHKYVLYDTSGRATPEKVADKVHISKSIASESRVFVHAHDDFGLATINTITGSINGADGCDTVVNGLGDRSGNASFEEVAVGLEQLYSLKTGISMEKIFYLCKFVYEVFNRSIPDIKPIIGNNAFCHATDMHIHGVYANASQAYEPFDIAQIGGYRTFTFLEGDYKNSLPCILMKYQIEPSLENMKQLFERLQLESRKKGRITEQEIEVVACRLLK